MPACAKCGNRYEEGQRFCRHCGSPVEAGGAGASVASRSGLSDDDLALFIGRNSDKYLSRFRKFRSGAEDSFNVTWHWPAFFFSFWWLLYRKMYAWAALVFFLGCVPYLGLIMMVVFGISGNYLYYRHAKRKVAELRAGPGTEVEKAAALARAGGVNNVAVIVAPLLIIFVVAILAAIAIPQFALYRQKAYEAKAKQQLLQACTLGEKLFAQDPSRMQIEPEDLLNAGLVHTEDVELLLLDGRKESFGISGRHRKGRKTYFTDQHCALREEDAGESTPAL